jgi:CBS domain-containing protein
MRHGVISIEPDDPAFAAADLMVETRFQSMPVVERRAGQPVLVGLITRDALLEALLHADTQPGRRESSRAVPEVALKRP